MTYRIKGWAEFQHYKNRRPPWIKLYRGLLDDPDWHQADPEACKALIMLWLIASESEDGSLPEVSKMAFRLRIHEDKLNQILAKLSHWLENDANTMLASGYQDASKVSAECYQDATPERETDQREIRHTYVDDSQSNASGVVQITAPIRKRESIPFDEIYQAYNEICGSKGRPMALRNNPKRQARIKAIWRESEKARSVDWWRAYFAKCMSIPWMTKGFNRTDGSTWLGADLDYLLQDKVITKIVEGAYDVA